MTTAVGSGYGRLTIDVLLVQAEACLTSSDTEAALKYAENKDLVHDRFSRMAFSTRRTRHAFAKNGGIDLLFWRDNSAFPFLGAVQAKYHSSPGQKTGVQDTRDFAGATTALPISYDRDKVGDGRRCVGRHEGVLSGSSYAGDPVPSRRLHRDGAS